MDWQKQFKHQRTGDNQVPSKVECWREVMRIVRRTHRGPSVPTQHRLFLVVFLAMVTFGVALPNCFSQVIPNRAGIGNRSPSTKKQTLQKLSPHSFVVDRILLKRKNQWLYGIILVDDDTILEVLAEREWLSKRNPALLNTAEQKAKSSFSKYQKIAIQQIDAWQKELQSGPRYPDLEHFLTEEKTAIQNRKTAQDSRFYKIRLAKKDISKTFRAKPPAKHLAGVAWKHKIPMVSSKRAGDLKKEFKNRDIQPLHETFDLSDELPPEPLNSETWQIKQAILRSEFCEEFRYQQAGGKFIQDGAKLKLNEMIAMVAGNLSIENAIGDLANDLPEFRQLIQKKKQDANNPDWWKGIQKKLERKWKGTKNLTQPTGVFIRRQSPVTGTSKATIQGIYVVRLPNGRWVVPNRFDSTATAGEVSDEQLEELQNDPRIKRAVKLSESFGIADGTQIKQALRFGAIVQMAIRRADQRMANFLSLHSKNLPGPPLKPAN